MKKILLTFFALSFVLTSCEFDKGFEEMNVNPAKANQIAVANKFAATQLYTSGSRYENWRASLIYQSDGHYLFSWTNRKERYRNWMEII